MLSMGNLARHECCVYLEIVRTCLEIDIEGLISIEHYD